MRTRLLIILLLLIFSDTYADNTIAIKAYYGDVLKRVKNDSGQTERCTYETAIVIKNMGGDPLVVPTRGIGPVTGYDPDGTIRVEFVFAFGELQGSRIKVPICDLAPVALKPGEVAIIEYELNLRADQSLKNVVVAYNVPIDVATEYGFWGGSIRCTLESRDK